MTKAYAEKGFYVTFVGIGINFNSDLINDITKTVGANYLTVNRYKTIWREFSNLIQVEKNSKKEQKNLNTY